MPVWTRSFFAFAAGGFAILAVLSGAAAAQDVSGQVTDAGGGPVAGARVTLFTGNLSIFQETRSDASGAYQIAGIPAGSYQLGVAAPGYGYQEAAVTVTGSLSRSFTLGPETEPGRWDILGNTPDSFGGTNCGILLPDGRAFYCHDTIDPLIIDPVTGQFSFPPASGKLQGCFMPAVLIDGRVIFVSGTNTPVYGPGTTDVKTFDPLTSQWLTLPSLNDGRWYPTLTQLPDGDLLAIGGGGINNPVRVKTCEVMDPATKIWSPVGDVAIGNEQSPIALLYTGEVLMTHRPPQLYNPAAKTWRAAADFVQGNRMPNGDHSDHEIVLMPNGEAVAIGFKSFDPANDPGNLVEIYDPIANQWRLGANFAPVRSRAAVVLLPNQKILVTGGEKEDPGDPTPTNAWNYMALTDLYDPATNSWRRLAAMNIAREYHQTPLLIPDGRIMTLGGEGQPGVEPPLSTAEIFTPPYLMRGVRPEIKDLTRTDAGRGDVLVFAVERTNAPTSIILMATSSNSHFSDAGNARYLVLPFAQIGNQVVAQIPSDAVTTPIGHYILFAMVDDIPSVGRIVRIDTTGSALPSISVRATDPDALEPGTDTGTFLITRAGPINAPLTVNFSVGGTAGDGTDYASLGTSVTIPAGTASVLVTVAPIDDPTPEPAESVIVTVSGGGSYTVGAPANATVMIGDDDTVSGDSDGDGLPDSWEMSYFNDLDETAGGDPDGDGLDNAGELAAGTDPTVADTDGDGLSDGTEVNQYGTLPTDPDSDGDGIPDGTEVADGSDPLNPNDPTPGAPPGGGGSGGGGSGCGATGLELLVLLAALSFTRERLHRPGGCKIQVQSR